MIKKSVEQGKRVLRASARLTAVIALALFAAGFMPGISAALARVTLPKFASGVMLAQDRGGEVSSLMMKVPDEPVTSGDVELPVAP
jgi:hypothetical protein